MHEREAGSGFSRGLKKERREKKKDETRWGLFGQQEGRTERRLGFWGGQSRGRFFGRTEREKRREKKRDGSRMEDFPAEKEGEAKRVS